jgi:PKD repeat protein
MRSRWLIGLLALASIGALPITPAADAATNTTANFSFEPSSPQPGETVAFTSTSEPADGTAIIDYRWDLDGNGSLETDTGLSSTATYTYSVPSTVLVRLQVTDDLGGRDAVRHTVTVGDGGGNPGGSGPSASFTFSPSAPVAGQPVLFTSTSSDPDGPIANQAWDLDGDANFDNGGGATALRTFAAPGSYVVGLRVTGANGKVAFYSQTVAVSGVGAPLGTSSKPGGSTLRLLSPFPVVRIAGSILRRGTRIRLLSVHAPAGARVSIRCSGRGCPFAKQVRTTRGAPTAEAARQVRVRRLERLLRPGVVVKVLVTRANTIGKYTRFKIRSGRPPTRVDRCLNPGSSRPVSCPAA